MANNHLFFLLLSLHAIAASAQSVFVSIDCGNSSNSVYTDKIGIAWSGDDLYIHTGENKVVRKPNSVSQVLRTLRVFSTRKKNCYSIPFSKGTQALVRASFYYGNYDKKRFPPSFDIQLDGNQWSTVYTSRKNLVSVEAIYVVRRDNISVCLAQTQPNQFPFISSLEVRSLDPSMYDKVDSNYAMFLARRTAFGTNQSIRYPADGYDRIWVAEPGSGNGIISVASNAQQISTYNCLDYPPSHVVQNAITTENTSIPIILDTNFLPPKDVPVYANFYFSDVFPLDTATQKRSFNIDVDDAPFTTTPIVPPFGNVTEFYTVNATVSSKNKVSLVSTSDSKFPPLINAMEVFIISGPLTNGTNNDDVQQLSLLQTQFGLLAEWSGDPCLPAPFTWDWVACNSDATPRITALYLSGFGLSGTLPDFSSMVALQTIDLHNNSLTGEIPAFLGDLPNLQLLNLADNNFSGTVPMSLSQNKKLKLDVSGNRKLCTSCESSVPSSSDKKSNKLPIILGVTIPVFIVSLVIVGFVAIAYHRRKTAVYATTMNAGWPI
ncbi:probable LRR receptor-like serine/threonine-protein kinase At1g05700 [Telopea speciosissima]|uniref:probable LRR receptor-like serine/threonine-protein kinase At1g05700 n=1 Tax=Telopea speciosissima TaxID=54955 RepID=UPI001CC3485D|nr:probable LRR receptor-like serine/threonine-protein kinase At1g05700 [Telopea speciosissima]